MPKVTVPPDVPRPAPAEISPVAFSSTEIFIILDLFNTSSTTSAFTFLKKFKFLILFKDFLFKISLKISPSSNSS